MRRILILISILFICVNSEAQILRAAPFNTIRPTVVSDIYGPEKVANGVFASTASWTNEENGTTITGGVAVVNAGSWSTQIWQTLDLTLNTSYKLEFDISGYSSGDIAIVIGNMDYADGESYISANGHYNVEILYDNSSAPEQITIFTWGDGAVMNVDNISLKEIL